MTTLESWFNRYSRKNGREKTYRCCNKEYIKWMI